MYYVRFAVQGKFHLRKFNDKRHAFQFASIRSGVVTDKYGARIDEVIETVVDGLIRDINR